MHKANRSISILVVGAKSSGKTSFLNFLRSSLALPPSKLRQQSLHDDYNILSPTLAAFPTFTPQFVETEIERERIGVTLWDSEGLEANVVDLQVKDIATFIESKFEDTFNEESKVARAPGFRDTQIHCVFLVLDPGRLDANIAAGQRANEINGVKAKANSFVKGRPGRSAGGLDEDLDLNVLRGLKGKTTLVPVISKADTITSAHMAHLKRAVWDSLKANGFETLEAISQEEEDSETYSETSEATELDEGDKYATKNEDDKFSMSSVLDSPSGSSSSFSASDFDVAKPGKQSKVLPARTPSSPTVPSTSLPLEAPALPLSIISPDPYEADVVGRRFPWGFADPTNVEHCDFMKLKQAVFTEWRDDLKEASRERWYERWRTSRLNKKTRRDGGLVGDISSRDWAR